MTRKAAQTIARHHMVRSGERVAVAVSGGPDSVALLEVLRDLAPELDVSLAVAHLNHRLRGDESDEDEAFVRGLATRLGLEFLVHSVDVRAEADRRGENLEQAARQARYQWFHLLIEEGRVDKVAVGHTRSDQAETVLYRLLRGSGSAGLSGIHPVLGDGVLGERVLGEGVLGGSVIRPLLGVSRAEVIAYLESGGHEWREDSSNTDEAFDRNRLRHSLMPLLAKDWNPNIEQTLARMADWAQAEEAYWAQTLPALSEGVIEPVTDRRGPDSRVPRGVRLNVEAMGRLPLAVQRRLLRAALEQVRGNLRGIDFEHIESLRRLIRRSEGDSASGRGSGSVHLPGATATRSFDRILLARSDAAEAAQAEFSLAVDVPGRFEIPGTSTVLVLRLLHRADVKDGYNGNWRQILDWHKVPKPLRLRNWRAGDRYRPLGRSGSRKLKALFQERQVEVWRRAGWPVVTAWAETPDSPSKAGPDGADRPANRTPGAHAETIVWTRGFGPAEQFAAQEGAETLLEITESG